jgi:starch-binding outer membrane protein, SusD/RagB family
MNTIKNIAMNHIKYLFITSLLLFLLAGCEQVLDKEPLDIISDATVWDDATLVDSYLANLYFETDFIEMRGDRYCVSFAMIPSLGGEGMSYGGHHEPYRASTRAMTDSYLNPQLDFWPYRNIRNCNYFMEQLLDGSTLQEDFIAQRVAEARFLRAYMYFQMAIRFGGVPIITEVQSISAPKEEIFAPRNTEKEVYDFIISEMDDLIEHLPSEYNSSDKGRPTKWAAYALKSRAALYAASIATYGTQQLDGLLGFPASDAQVYARMAYDASDAIINNGIHALYEELDDPAENFHSMMLDESDANREAIFVQVFDYSKNRGHSFTPRAMPHDFQASWGSMYYLYDWVERFEFKSGASGDSISREELEYEVSGKEWTINEIFGYKDPRFHASVFYPEAPWNGGVTYFHSGTYVNGELLTSGTAPNGRPYKATERNTTKSGFMVKKRTRPDVYPSGGFPGLDNDDTDFSVFRLGEIYLNKAEAAHYLGNDSEALTLMNRVRERAGMPPKASFAMDEYQNERLVELSWENHSFWDLRRWRIAKETLDGVRMAGVKWYYNYDTKKYRIDFINAEGVSRIFQNHYYYMPMTVERMTENPNFVQNPGY